MRFCLFYTPAVSNYCGERVKSTLKKIEILAEKKEDLGLTSSVIEVHFARDNKERECIVLVQYIN